MEHNFNSGLLLDSLFNHTGFNLRIYNCSQGSEQWDEIRRGRPTASNFGKILTPKTLALSSQRTKYAIQLAAQRKRVETPQPPPTAAMEWGTEHEPFAVADYEKRTGAVCEAVGFVYPDETSLWGCSPDRFVLDQNGEYAGLLECKCPNVETLIYYSTLEGIPDEYRLQVQCQLWITGLDWCDFFVYHPDLSDAVLRRAYPEDEVFEAFEEHLPTFCKEIATFEKMINPAIDWSSLD